MERDALLKAERGAMPVFGADLEDVRRAHAAMTAELARAEELRLHLGSLLPAKAPEDDRLDAIEGRLTLLESAGGGSW